MKHGWGAEEPTIQTVELILKASHIGKLKIQLTTIYIIRNRKKLQIDKFISVFKIIQTNQYIIEYKFTSATLRVILCYIMLPNFIMVGNV